jgi:hypothetical protein
MDDSSVVAAWRELLDEMTPAELHDLHAHLRRRIAELSFRDGQPCYLMIDGLMFGARVALALDADESMKLWGARADVFLGIRWPTLALDSSQLADAFYRSRVDGGPRLALRVAPDVAYVLRPLRCERFRRVATVVG